MNILVIGGTRFIGAHTVRRLSALGHSVTVFHRGKTDSEFLPDKISRIHGDRKNLSDFRSQFASLAPDIILDSCAGSENHARELVKALQGVASRVCLLSSGDVYRAYGIMMKTEEGFLQDVPIPEDAELRTVLYPFRGEELRSEDDPKRDRDFYDKIPVERIVTENFDTTVLRLPAVYGPGDHRPWAYLKRMLDGRQTILLGEEMAQWRFVKGYIDDVADAIVKSMFSDNAIRQVYNVGEPDARTEREWVEAIARAVEWEGEIRVLPEEDLPDHLRSPGNPNQHLTYDTTRIRHDLGWESQTEMSEGLKRTVEWEQSNPPSESDPLQFDYDAEDEVIVRT